MSHEDIDLKAVIDQLQTENERLRKNLSYIKNMNIQRTQAAIEAIKGIFTNSYFWFGYFLALALFELIRRFERKQS